MMIYALIFVTVLLISIGLYAVLFKTLRLPSYKAIKAIKYLHGKRTSKEILEKTLKPLTSLLTRLFPLSDYKEKKMASDFKRLEIEQKPQDFVSIAKAKSLALILIGCILIPVGLPVFTLLIGVIALLLYFRNMGYVKKRIEKLNHEIESEMPRFIETMNYSLDGSRDLISFVERYRSVAGKGLGKELDQLLIDLKTGNEQTALQKMGVRLNTPTVSKLVAILCNSNQGKRQALELLEMDVRAKEREYIKDKLSNQPKRIRVSSVILTVLMIFLFMIPIALMIIENMKGVGF